MPELPEVETTVRGLRKHIVGQPITDVWTSYNSAFHYGKPSIKDPVYFRMFRQSVTGTHATNIERRAKNILITLSSGDTILIHMKMTGHLLYGRYEFNKKANSWKAAEHQVALLDPFNAHVRLVFTFANGEHLAFSDMRKFAKVMLIKKGDALNHPDLTHLGPEPLHRNFTLAELTARLSKKPKSPIKSVLMDQHVLAGIGNIYSDEILWSAGIHPKRSPASLSPAELSAIFQHTREILNRSITLGGDSMSDYRNIYGEKGGFHPYHNAYRQHGKVCTKPGCGGIIERIVIGGRSTHFCPRHQK